MTYQLIVQTFGAAASIATVVVAFLVFRQIKLVKEQATTTFEDGLAGHYRRIMEDIPTDIWMGSGLEALDIDRLEYCRDAIYRYLDLCQEQTFLHEEGRITDKTWTQWSDGIRSNMKIPAFKEVWDGVKIKRPDSFLELRKFLSSE